MTTYALIIYLSTGFGSGTTGGPTTLDGFTTKEKCLVAAKEAEKIPKFDWAYCFPMVK